MSLDIGAALEDGLVRTRERNGLVLVAAFFALSVVSSIFAADLLSYAAETLVEETELTPEDLTGPGANPLLADDPTEPLVGFSALTASLGLLAAGIAQFVVTIAATRTLASDETDSIPGEFVTRRLGWVALNAIVGGFVFAVLVSIGFVVFVVPGVFLLVSLFFWWFVVTVEDESFVTGFSESWDMTSGNRWQLLLLGIIVALLGIVVNEIGSAIAEATSLWGAVVVLPLFSAPVAVFTIATGARAYRQLRDGDGTTADVDSEPGPVAQ